jgi:hypothetical protein
LREPGATAAQIMRREFVSARFAAVFATRQIAWGVIHVPQVCLSGLPAGR